MEQLLIQLLQSQGIWAVLFVSLLLYTIKKNDKRDEVQEAREENYQKLLLDLDQKFLVVEAINEKLVRL